MLTRWRRSIDAKGQLGKHGELRQTSLVKMCLLPKRYANPSRAHLSTVSVIPDEPEPVAVFGCKFLVGIVGVCAGIVGVGCYLELHSCDLESWLEFSVGIFKLS